MAEDGCCCMMRSMETPFGQEEIGSILIKNKEKM